jgi:hypothetical protein
VLGAPVVRAADRLPPHELTALRNELEQAGLSLNRSYEADRALAELRLLYEPYVTSLSNRLMTPLPRWRPASRTADNWQTSPTIDGDAHF